MSLRKRGLKKGCCYGKTKNTVFTDLQNFLGEQKITYEVPKPIARGFEISSRVKDREAALDVPVTYDLYEEQGQRKIYDIFMDGVSMTEDLKFQFNKIIKGGSISGLLARMSERLIKAQKETGERGSAGSRMKNLVPRMGTGPR